MLFNYLAEKEKLPVKAFSKGLRLSKKNKGPLSSYAENYLAENYNELEISTRMPIPVTRQDFEYYDQIIALDETEHRALMKQFFPTEENQITYWNFADDYIEAPAMVLPKLEEKVKAFVADLKTKY